MMAKQFDVINKLRIMELGNMNSLSLDSEISKAQKWNRHLSRMIEELEIQLDQRRQRKFSSKPSDKMRPGREETIHMERKNLQKLITFYELELQFERSNNIEALLTQMKQIEETIRKTKDLIRKVDRRIREMEVKIEDEWKKSKKQIKTIQLPGCHAEVENLRRKLGQLTRRKVSTEKMVSTRKRNSSTLGIGSKQTDRLNDKTFNKIALYKNLIKYYQKDEEKLKTEIERLEEHRKKELEEVDKLDHEIKDYQEKVDKLKGSKLQTESKLYNRLLEKEKEEKQERDKVVPWYKNKDKPAEGKELPIEQQKELTVQEKEDPVEENGGTVSEKKVSEPDLEKSDQNQAHKINVELGAKKIMMSDRAI